MGKVLDIRALGGYLAPLQGCYFGKGYGYRAWGFQAPHGGCYFGKVVDIRLLGFLASIMGKVVDIVGLLGFLVGIIRKVVDTVGLLGFFAPPLCLPTLGWDLKSERPYILFLY